MPILFADRAGRVRRRPRPPPGRGAARAPELRCAYIIRAADGVHAGEDPNLHVLAQTAAEGRFAPTLAGRRGRHPVLADQHRPRAPMTRR